MAVNAEWKFFELFASGTASITGVIIQASHNEVVQGTGPRERLGRKITIRSLQVQGSFQLPTTLIVAHMAQRIRIVFYIDTATNGSARVVSEMLSGPPTSIFAFRELSNEPRIPFIYDEQFDVPVWAVHSTGTSIPTTTGFEFDCELNLPIEFDGSAPTGELGTIRTNNIGCFIVCEAGDNPATIAYVSRIRYTDG